MIVQILLLVAAVQQLGLCESPNHSNDSHKKIKAADIVRAINRTPKITWKANMYGLKEVDPHSFAKTKLGVKMDDMQMMTATNLRKLEIQTPKEKQKPNPNYSALPENFSWAKTNKTTCPISNIRDQSNCGSCWAVAPASVLSDAFCLQSNATFTLPLSHEKLVACTPGNYGCSGGYMKNVFDYMKQNGTVTGGEYDSDKGCQMYTIRPCGAFTDKMPCDYSEAITPKCKQSKCNNEWYKYKEEKQTKKILDTKWVSAYFSDDRARQEIYDNGPVMTIFWVYPDFVFYKKGIYIHKMGWWPIGGHAVKIVGWGIENGTKYWHVANSWGKNWGEDGHFRIRRGTNECGFDWYITALIPSGNSTSSE